MKISVGNSRIDKKWKNRDISWEDLCKKVSVTQRTTETVEEYRKLKKGSQDSIKDVGGFVGGHLREGRRKNGMVLCRSMLTLDMDYGEPVSGKRSRCFTTSDAAYIPLINTYPKSLACVSLSRSPEKSPKKNTRP